MTQQWRKVLNPACMPQWWYWTSAVLVGLSVVLLLALLA